MKQERSLFTSALEQTSNVPTAIIRPRPRAGLWSPIPSIGSAIAPSRCTYAFWQVRHGARDPADARRFTRPSPRVERRPTGGGRRWFPGPSSRGRWPLCFHGHAPPYSPLAVLGVPLPTMLIVCRRHWGPVIGWERRRVRPVIAPPPFAPPPVTQLRSRG